MITIIYNETGSTLRSFKIKSMYLVDGSDCKYSIVLRRKKKGNIGQVGVPE